MMDQITNIYNTKLALLDPHENSSITCTYCYLKQHDFVETDGQSVTLETVSNC